MIQNKIGKMIIVLKKRAGFLQSDSFLQSDGESNPGYQNENLTS